MNKRTHLLIGSYVIAALLLVQSCGPSRAELEAQAQRVAQEERAHYKVAIESVLTQDATTGKLQDIVERVKAIHNIDTSGCPAEFRTAYLDHTYAWEYLAKVRRARAQLASDGSVESALMRSLMAAANDSKDTPLEDLFRSDTRLGELDSQASEGISDTFHKLEGIAVGFGAVLPPS